MNIHELPLMFPSVLDGSCPLGVFADAVMECDGMTADWHKIGDMLQRLGVNQSYSHGGWVVTVQRIDETGNKLDTWSAAIRNDSPAWIIKKTKAEAQTACGKLAVHWVEWYLGVRDTWCAECGGKGKIYQVHPDGWYKCEKCNGEGIVGKLKEEVTA